MTEQEHFEQWQTELSPERQVTALCRALKALDWPYRFNGGVLEIPEDVDYEGEEFQDALHEVFVGMYVREELEELAAEGAIVPDGIDDDGEIIYAVA